jgi:hypothetical protein
VTVTVLVPVDGFCATRSPSMTGTRSPSRHADGCCGRLGESRKRNRTSTGHYRTNSCRRGDDFTRAFTIQFGIADAKSEVARPLMQLVRQHLPANHASITAAIRLGALLTRQVQWPGMTRQAASVLALRPASGC